MRLRARPHLASRSVPRESNRGVVEVSQTGRAEIRQGAADRNDPLRLGQRHTESLGPNELVEVVGQRPRLAGIEFFERSLDRGVDLRATDLAEIAFPIGTDKAWGSDDSGNASPTQPNSAISKAPTLT